MKIKEKIKALSKNLFNKMVQHEVCFLIVLGVIAACFMWGFSEKVDHTVELLKSEKEKAILVIQLERLQSVSEEQQEAFNFQWEIIRKQNEQLQKAEATIEIQNDALQQLIRYLKETKQWPPKIKPVDPNSLARSGAI
tara:strand:- start:91 stop:504 length:414 start_codon:yes stop_codon:yes gene_type:complete